MEDVRIGGKRFARITTVVGNTTVNFKADSRRVTIRLVSQEKDLTAASQAEIHRTADGATLAFMFANAGKPTDEITLETYGTLVYEAFSCATLGQRAIVVEVFQDDQWNAPSTPG